VTSDTQRAEDCEVFFWYDPSMCSKLNCSFAARPDVLKIINGLLAQKVSAKKIEQQTGIPHTTAGRHSQFCVIRQQAATLKARTNPRSQKIVVWWPDAPYPADQITENCFVLKVVYEPGYIGNPQALAPDGWTPEAQTLFMNRVSLDVKMSYIDGQHEDALRENLERDAGNQIAEVLADENTLPN
jgi:hypothetical protein